MSSYGYGIVGTDWYNGKTARRFRGDAIGLALGPYLMVRHANLLGSYRLPLEYVVADLGFDEREVEARFQACVETGFLEWDRDEQWVWIVELARVRLGLRQGDVLNVNDKRRGVLQRIFDETAGRSPRLAAGIFGRYGAALLLKMHNSSTAFPQMPVEKPSEGASLQPLAKGSEASLQPLAKGSLSSVQHHPLVTGRRVLGSLEVVPLSRLDFEDDDERDRYITTEIVRPLVERATRPYDEHELARATRELCDTVGVPYAATGGAPDPIERIVAAELFRQRNAAILGGARRHG